MARKAGYIYFLPRWRRRFAGLHRDGDADPAAASAESALSRGPRPELGAYRALRERCWLVSYRC